MPQPVTRRRVVASVAGAVGGSVVGPALVAGCSADLPTGPATTRARTRDQLSADETAVADLVARLTSAVDLLTRTGRHYPALVAPLAATLAAERAHLATLRRSARAADLPSSAAPTEHPRTSRAAALGAARQSTASLRSAYFSAAGRADSGSFARLLASMGCSLSQRLPGMSL